MFLQLLLFSAAYGFQESTDSDFDIPRPQQQQDEFCLNLTASPYLEKFVDALPQMPVILLTKNSKVTLGAYKIIQKLHRDLPPTMLYAFGTSQATATSPGPTLIAEQGVPAHIRWENHIPDMEHFLPVDKTINWPNPRLGHVPIVVHNHGLADPAWSDGHPQAWFTVLGEHGSTYVTQDYFYPNEQLPAMLWYHDHTQGLTRLNILAGLVGVYILESPALTPVWIPAHYHVLVVQDRAFYDDGRIKYPTVGANPRIHPQWCPDYFGDVVLVNGKVWPYLDLSLSIQRFRLLNGANSKAFAFVLSDPRLTFIKIGTDGGFLRTPVAQKILRVGTGERVDFLLDFSKSRIGHVVELFDVGTAPFPSGPAANQSVMLFRITIPVPRQQNHPLPAALTPELMSMSTPAEIAFETTGLRLVKSEWEGLYKRPFILSVEFDSGGNALNNVVALYFQNELQFEDPPTEVLELSSREAWVFISSLVTAHPIHLHLVNFVVIARQRFNATRYNEGTCSFMFKYPDPRSCYTAHVEGPDADQIGLRDTAMVLPSYVTWFYVATSPNYGSKYSFDPTEYPHYIWHCHVLEHEDNEMMRPLMFSTTGSLRINASFPCVDIN